MRSIVKHSYVKGMRKAAKAKAHVNYIQYRSGEDRGKEPRSFFDDKREGKQGREVKKEIDQVGAKVVHKLILSPGVPGVDVQAYTRQVMHDLGRAKGLDLRWSAVVHTNTENAHAHVVILGKDKQEREVQLRRDDYITARQAGDRYLERHHDMERFLVRDVDLSKEQDYRAKGDRVYTDLVKELEAPRREQQETRRYERREWDLEAALKALPEDQRIKRDGKEYTKFSKLEELKELGEQIKQKEVERLEAEEYKKLRSWIGTKERGGDDYFERLAKDKWDKREKKRERKQERLPGEDEREFKKLDNDLKKMFRDLDREGSGESLGKGYRERQRETQGRLGADHGHSTANQEIERLKREAELEPARQEEIEKQIEEVKQWDQEQRQADSRWGDLDSLLGERYGQEQRELAELLRPEQKQEPEREAEPNQEEREPEKDQGKELEKQAEPSPEDSLDKPLEQAEDRELLQDGPEQKEQEPEVAPTVTESKWEELDAMLGDRFGRDDYDERQIAKDLEIAQSQQEMRQFQDLHNMQEQTPQLEEQELDRDSGEDYFARGEY